MPNLNDPFLCHLFFWNLSYHWLQADEPVVAYSEGLPSTFLPLCRIGRGIRLGLCTSVSSLRTSLWLVGIHSPTHKVKSEYLPSPLKGVDWHQYHTHFFLDRKGGSCKIAVTALTLPLPLKRDSASKSERSFWQETSLPPFALAPPSPKERHSTTSKCFTPPFWDGVSDIPATTVSARTARRFAFDWGIRT